MDFKEMNNRYRCAFSYFGSKSRFVHKYPKPKYETIIEPFAGGASYSLYYADHKIILTDIDVRVAAIWNFLLSNEAIKWINLLPAHYYIKQGMDVRKILPINAPYGLLEILRAEANQGSQGTNYTCNYITKFGEDSWYRLKPRLLYWIPKIKHWIFLHQSYKLFKNKKATWFIDPPYSDTGQAYKHHDINYNELKKWCLSRRGQVIVCESEKANWLPFIPFFNNSMNLLEKITREVIWTNID